MATIELRPSDIERFHEKVGPPNENGCRLWTGEVNNRGYGRLVIYRGDSRRRLLAHRLAFEFATGADPGTAKLLHSCDTPPCCEPSHLRRGTQADNMADAKAKGRMVNPPLHRGQNHPRAKLTQLQVDEIRALHAEGGLTHRQLGERYGVSGTQVGYIVRGQSWGGLAEKERRGVDLFGDEERLDGEAAA